VRPLSVRIASLVPVALVVVAVVGGCAQTNVTPSESPAASTSATPIASTQPSSAAPSPLIVVDEGLLGVLPAEVGGIALVSDPETAASIASDPDLAASASAIAVAYAIAPGASVADDVAVISVVQLRPDVFDDGFYRSWRDSYDAAACAAAGGVTGNAQAEFGGHETHIGSCAQGAFTYHVYLEDRNVFVSITSVGARRLGEQVVTGLGE
jgi:hypothetical protein